MLDDLKHRLRALFRRDTVERELDDELRFHFDRQVEKYMQDGLDRTEAVRRARLEFGGLDQVKEEYRDSLGVRLLTDLRRDVVLAVRTLKRQPGFSATAILTLALGIGATTAIFSVVYGVLLKPLPFYEPDRLVALYHLAPGFGGATKAPPGNAMYFTYREHGRVFEDIGLWNAGDVSVVRNGEPEQVQALRITDGLLPLLGIRPGLGRLIRREDDVPGAPNRVALTHAYWQRTFGGARDVVGQSLIIDAKPYEIIGVLPASFKLLDTHPQVVLPARINRATTLTAGFGPYHGVARLKPGVTLAQANDDIARMIPLLTKLFPLMPGVTQAMWDAVGTAPNVRPLSDDVIGEMGRPLWILLGTVAFVLLMAWTNVANLLLVRAETRQREFAVRRALGASRGRMVAELLAESLMLGVAGGAAGVLFARAAIGLLRRIAPVALPRVDDIGIGGVVLLFTLALSVVTALMFGFVPALRLGSNFLVLKEAGRSISDAPGRHRTRNTLVVAQVALTFVLLIVSGLMVRTFIAMRQVQPGFVGPAELQTFRVALPGSLIKDPQKVARTYEEFVERLKHVPGVVAIGLANQVPMDGSVGQAPLSVEDHPVAGLPPSRRAKGIGPGYFETIGTPLLAGRAMTWIDIHHPTPIAWISENLAREYWEDPSKALGKRIGGSPQGPWNEIVGVVGNVREQGLNQPAPAIVYFPMSEYSPIDGTTLFVGRDMLYLVRSNRVGTPGFVRELQEAVWSVNPDVPLANVRTLDEIMAESMAQTSFAMVMLAIAAAVALLLALVGIYGVVSYIAAERTYEIGIRMALGAQSGDVRGLFLRHGLTLTLTGIVLGIGAAVLLTPTVSALLYGVAPTDPVTYAGVAIALGAVTLLATYLPARRASRMEPLLALRSGM